MIRRAIGAAVLAVLAASAAVGETYAEKVQKVDAEKKTLTIPVDGKDRELPVDAKVDVQAQVRQGKRLRVTPVKDGLKGVKPGMEATVTTEKRDGKEVVTKIVLLMPEKK